MQCSTVQYVQYSVSQYSVVQLSAVQSEEIVAVAAQHVIAQTDSMSRIYCTPLHVQHTTAQHTIVGIQAISLFTQMASRPVNLIGRKIRLSLCLSVPHILKVTRSTRSNNTFNHSFQDNTISDFFYEPPGLCVSFYPFK